MCYIINTIKQHRLGISFSLKRNWAKRFHNIFDALLQIYNVRKFQVNIIAAYLCLFLWLFGNISERGTNKSREPIKVSVYIHKIYTQSILQWKKNLQTIILMIFFSFQNCMYLHTHIYIYICHLWLEFCARWNNETRHKRKIAKQIPDNSIPFDITCMKSMSFVHTA